MSTKKRTAEKPLVSNNGAGSTTNPTTTEVVETWNRID